MTSIMGFRLPGSCCGKNSDMRAGLLPVAWRYGCSFPVAAAPWPPWLLLRDEDETVFSLPRFRCRSLRTAVRRGEKRVRRGREGVRMGGKGVRMGRRSKKDDRTVRLS